MKIKKHLISNFIRVIRKYYNALEKEENYDALELLHLRRKELKIYRRILP